MHASAPSADEPGQAVGTVAYMSPEQARGKNSMRALTFFRSASCSTRWLPASLPFRGETRAVIFERHPGHCAVAPAAS